MSFAAAELSSKHDGMLLVITEDTASAERMLSETADILGSDENLLCFPGYETLPYDSFAPRQDVISERAEALYFLRTSKKGAVFAAADTVLQRLPPPEFIVKSSFIIKKGEERDPEELRRFLAGSGYLAVETVMEHGEFSMRGSILDVFPMGAMHPCRIDFFDTEVDSIRFFDPETQRSDKRSLDGIRILPAREYPTEKDAIERFRIEYRKLFGASLDEGSVYKAVSEGSFPGGIEYYLPLFFEKTFSVFDYLPEGSIVVTAGDTGAAMEGFLHDTAFRARSGGDSLRPRLAPDILYWTKPDIKAAAAKFGNIQLTALPSDDGSSVKASAAPLPDVSGDGRNFRKLSDFIAEFRGRIIISAPGEGRLDILDDALRAAGIKAASERTLRSALESSERVVLTASSLAAGALFNGESQTAVITETELFGSTAQFRKKRKANKDFAAENVVKSLGDLKPGSRVVHFDHGIGKYLGLETITTDGFSAEYLVIEYAGGSRLYVPVTSLSLVSRYTGADNPPLNSLGSDSWKKSRQKAIKKARDTAAEILDTNARRSMKKGFAFKMDKKGYAEFCGRFPYDMTEDQEKAEHAVLADMESERPMDRLVCGDVGFGKTEIALRAACLAALNGKQTAVLAPTTLLAEQHFETFSERFSETGATVEVLSRFKTAKQSKEILEKLEAGTIDVIIGTHKLLSSKIKFKDLGLLIVDEEHRFGVRQKEKIKSMRADIDILTLTATPIPRTLNLAFSGLRDLSIIATPPAGRLSIKTLIRHDDDHIIKEAVLRELNRGGQVYFLHNDIKTIEAAAERLQGLVPQARIRFAHGRMEKAGLEKTMNDFYRRRFNVLVCTSIIETGLDIPTANTIIIERADKFGLAQLHQIRGRVGRSKHQAYAYLLVPEAAELDRDAKARLRAIESSDELGAGFSLATSDLEIRGAGELLGEEQSGQITSVGFDLYMDMLENAVKFLKEGREPDENTLVSEHAEVDIGFPALIPENYVNDVGTRLRFYKRIAGTATRDETDSVISELGDRFGKIPEEVMTLGKVTVIRQEAEKLGIVRLRATKEGGLLEFNDHPPVKPEKIIAMIRSEPWFYKMEGPDKLRYKIPGADIASRVKVIESVMRKMA
ncbi:MAG: transcription-repair coupling factor [Succinivibrionaceae bacterium]|nr:transcription-repair coupling factor [Succinivibrionaceae bacterium]MDY6376712.1 transcription-repair coupling factor [Succinivibrionaceae bacterium]